MSSAMMATTTSSSTIVKPFLRRFIPSAFLQPAGRMKSPNRDVTGTAFTEASYFGAPAPAGWTRTGADLWRQARGAVWRKNPPGTGTAMVAGRHSKR